MQIQKERGGLSLEVDLSGICEVFIVVESRISMGKHDGCFAGLCGTFIPLPLSVSFKDVCGA